MIGQDRETLDYKSIIAGAVAGLLISAMAGPYVVDFMNHQYRSIGAPGYRAPELEVDLNKSTSEYPEGAEVPDFEGLEWQKRYEIYRLSITNTGSKPIRQIDADVPLPGCSVFTNKEGPSVDGVYEASPMFSVRYSNASPTKIKSTSYSCSMVVESGYIAPGNSIVVEFVTTDEFRTCDIAMGVFPKEYPVITVEYRWEKANTIFNEESQLPMSHLKEEQLDLFDQEGKGFEASQRHGFPYHIFIIGNGTSFDSIASRCGFDQVSEY